MHPNVDKEQMKIIVAYNSKPINGINMIKELLEGVEDLQIYNEIAEFFINQKLNLDLDAVGDYLSGPGDENQQVLKCFTAYIDIKGHSFTESLRVFLRTFKLPGESQKIDRLVKSFSEAYFQQNKGKVVNADSAYLLAFQAIMLNTDLHNPSIKKNKMTFDGLIKNLKGCNDGKDFDRNFLKEMYDDIQSNPFELNFVKINPGYELSSSALNKDSTFNNIDLLLKSKSNPQDVFPGIGMDVKATVDKVKPWLNIFIGYQGTITLKDVKNKTEVTIQIYKPSLFSRWLFGDQPKVIIQPVNKAGLSSAETIKLAGEIAAAFESPLSSTKATYEYEKKSMENAYVKARFKDKLKKEREEQPQQDNHKKSSF